jgi:His/Glu/Gln/Arg/opine family amino acid ABC transporter permease subunit
MSNVATLDTDEVDPDAPKLPPELPSLPAGEWMRKNLFSSLGSSVLTVLFGVLALVVFWSVVNFMFENAERDWDAVRANLRLYFTYAYPVSQYSRVWVSFGIILALVGLTVGLWPPTGVTSIRKIATRCLSLGGVIFAAALAVQGPLQRDAEGVLIFDEDFEAVRGSWSSGLETRIWWFVVAAVLIAVGLGLWFGYGERRRAVFVKTSRIAYGLFGAAVLSLWVVRYGHYNGQAGQFDYADPDSLVAMSTRIPWTVMWVLLGVAVLAGGALRSVGWIKRAIPFLWLISPFVIFWVVLRDPALDYGYVARVDVPMYLAFAVIGGLVLYALTGPELGEKGRAFAFGLVVVAAFTFVGGFFGWFAMLQKARISFVMLAAFALVAHNFAGEKAARRGYVAIWAGVLLVFHYFITMMNTPSTLELLADSFLGGFMFSIFAAVFGLMFSFPLGVLLALARTSTLPLFRIMATTFIEVVRGVPFITVLFFFSIMLPLFLPGGMRITEQPAGIIGLVLFSAAYLAENVRGGLQSIRRGQFEAADAIGLTTAQRTSLIVLPQALRVSIPPLVGQAIASYKETSLFAIIGVIDFLRIANSVVPNQSQPINFIGHKREGLLFVCLLYWAGSYAMSKYSQKLEKKLGVGDR